MGDNNKQNKKRNGGENIFYPLNFLF